MSAASPQPGWYPDAGNPGHERWWNGGEWSHVTRPAPGAAPPGYQPYPQGPGSAPPYAPAYGGAAATADGVPLAGPGWRLLARLIDGLILGLLTIGLGTVFGLFGPLYTALKKYFDQAAALESGQTPDPTSLLNDPALTRAFLGFAIIQLVCGFLYEVLFLHLRGATPGKMAVGIRVRSWDVEGRPTVRQAALRWATRDLINGIPSFGAIYALLDSLWLLWDPRRQCLHDKLPRTSVVRAR